MGALILSPLTNVGLFHRVIMQSGAPTSYQGTQSLKTNHEMVNQLASLVDCKRDNISSVIDCLRALPLSHFMDNQKTMQLGFSFVYGEQMLPEEPFKLLNKLHPKLDLLFGTVSNEGANFLGIIDDKLLNLKNHFDAATIVEMMKKYLFSGLPNQAELIKYYTRNFNVNTSQIELRSALAHALADPRLVCPTILFAQSLHGRSPSTSKFYSYRLEQPLYEGVMNCPVWKEVCHAVDVIYSMGTPLTYWHANNDRHYTFDDPKTYQLSLDMIGTWTSFVRTGNVSGHPLQVHGSTTTWAPAFKNSSSSAAYMRLNVDHYGMVEDYFKQSCDHLWRDHVVGY